MFNDWQLGFIAEQEGDSPSSREGQIKYIKKRLKSNPELANDEEYQDQNFGSPVGSIGYILGHV